jgi:hypothetical protein
MTVKKISKLSKKWDKLLLLKGGLSILTVPPAGGGKTDLD